MSGKLPADWFGLLADELSQPYFAELQAFVEAERLRHSIYPPADEVFTAFALTPWKQVRVVLLGQDPYHQPGQAHGLCFSVRPGVAPPPSLVNIFRELRDDIGCVQPSDGDLEPWARQGVLLLNTTLTVRANQAHSHRGHGWERFTDLVIEKLNAEPIPLVFALWGRPAQEKAKRIDATRHAVLMAAHPSPLSAHRGFLGSRPFSAINQALQRFGHPEIDW